MESRISRTIPIEASKSKTNTRFCARCYFVTLTYVFIPPSFFQTLFGELDVRPGRCINALCNSACAKDYVIFDTIVRVLVRPKKSRIYSTQRSRTDFVMLCQRANIHERLKKFWISKTFLFLFYFALSWIK